MYYANAEMNIQKFSDLCQINRKNLIYYDRIGLLRPKRVGENGYRYYYYSQLEQVFIISSLKTFGFSLSEIKRVLEDRDGSCYYNQLIGRRKLLEEKMELLRQEQNAIQDRIAALELRDKMGKSGEVFVEEWEERPVYRGRYLGVEKCGLTDDVYTDFVKSYRADGITDGFLHNLQINGEGLKHGDHRVAYSYFRVQDRRYANGVIPAGKYVMTCTRGYYGEIGDAYEKLFAYMADHGLELAGDAYEETLTDELANKDPNGYVLRVVLRVKSKKEENECNSWMKAAPGTEDRR